MNSNDKETSSISKTVKSEENIKVNQTIVIDKTKPTNIFTSPIIISSLFNDHEIINN
jgi:hypothetical protein